MHTRTLDGFDGYCFWQIKDSDCSDSDSIKGFLNNLHDVPGVAAVPTSNLEGEENATEEVFPNEARQYK